jgi:uncharacterized protein YeaO (DUF488 family)
MKHAIAIKRIYDPPAKDDGARILIDRLWPRGVSKDAAALTLWFKDVAPSNELRKSHVHDPASWQEFRRLYRKELDGNAEAIEDLRRYLRKGKVTLLYASRDPDHNHALILKEYLE